MRNATRCRRAGQALGDIHVHRLARRLRIGSRGDVDSGRKVHDGNGVIEHAGERRLVHLREIADDTHLRSTQQRGILADQSAQIETARNERGDQRAADEPAGAGHHHAPAGSA